MKDHLVKNEDIQSCYCGEDLRDVDWRPEFSSHKLYRTVKCKCGKKNRVKMNFSGSGHDEWKPKISASFDAIVKDEHEKLK